MLNLLDDSIEVRKNDAEFNTFFVSSKVFKVLSKLINDFDQKGYLIYKGYKIIEFK